MGEPEQYNSKEIIHRVGTFFLIIGIGLLLIFLLSEAGGETAFQYFCGSILLIVMGFLFRAQYKRSVTPSGRFGVIKRLKRNKDE